MPYPGARSVSTISHGPRPPVLVVDFAQFDTTTTLAELLAATRDRTVYRIDAVSDLGRPIAPVSIPEMAADYAGQVAALAPVPAVVVAYCSAAVLGMHIVGNLVANGHPEPRMILVEPTWLTTQILGQVLATIRRDLGASTGDDPPDVTDLAPIIEVLTADLRASALADGIPDEDVDVVLELLVDRYRAWFAFLLGARRATVPPPPRRLRLITSRDAGRAAAIARVLPGVPVTVLPLEHADLLRAEPLDRTIRDLLDHADADDALGQVRDGIR